MVAITQITLLGSLLATQWHLVPAIPTASASEAIQVTDHGDGAYHLSFNEDGTYKAFTFTPWPELNVTKRSEEALFTPAGAADGLTKRNGVTCKNGDGALQDIRDADDALRAAVPVGGVHQNKHDYGWVSKQLDC
jgi:hypothetical protein